MFKFIPFDRITSFSISSKLIIECRVTQALIVIFL